jgi:hypothetical protein
MFLFLSQTLLSLPDGGQGVETKRVIDYVPRRDGGVELFHHLPLLLRFTSSKPAETAQLF